MPARSSFLAIVVVAVCKLFLVPLPLCLLALYASLHAHLVFVQPETVVGFNHATKYHSRHLQKSNGWLARVAVWAALMMRSVHFELNSGATVDW